ncbi:Autophagy protein 9 [Fasciola gigantica]|uniref:Autophagy-related protein 9 n=1 Tax=Fasciola gigantica TaxID=46835 RepID=A0A504YC84_FASGI|nr:Autophagy protein 9 [Fasciola gigantica]
MAGFRPNKSQYKSLDEGAAVGQFMHLDQYREHMLRSMDPDRFFKDVYNYHQFGGFYAILLTEFLWLLKFVFLVFVGIELTTCTQWDVLANKTAVVTDWDDVFIPPGQCWANLSILPALLVTGTVFTLIYQLIGGMRRLQRYWATRRFCSMVLSMPNSSTGLGDMTWVEVQRRLIDSQVFPSLDELNICHRILRHENYLISLIDQDVLPVRFSLPVTSPPWPYIFLSDGYLFNLRLILFNTPWSPFASHWRLQSEYKELPRRYQLAHQLGTLSRVLGLLNLLFAPVILLAQLLVFLCANAERLRYQPGSIMGRRWSNYAKLYLRHYNELPHQFVARIGMVYQSACQYLDCFISRNLIALAETGAFILGSSSVAFFLMGVVHEQMMHLSGYWAILVAGGLLARACISFIPDENVVYSPQALLITILGKIHRVRDHWIEQGATYRVCAEFSQLFQYRLSAAFEELFSAVITPFLLIFVVPNHTLEIVDFLRNYTVELPDLGDVCSFAQMDVRRHGDPHWRPDTYEDDGTEPTHQTEPEHDASRTIPTDGKIELSLMHFHLNNPTYPLPASSRAYLLAVRKQLMKDIHQPLVQAHPDANGQPSLLGGLTGPLSPASLFTSLYGGQTVAQRSSVQHGQSFGQVAQLKKVSHLPGPSYIPNDTLGFVGALTQSMRASMHRSDPGVIRSSAFDPNIQKDLSSGSVDPSTSRTPDDRKSDLSIDPHSKALGSAPTTMVQSVDQSRPLDQSLMAYAQPGYLMDPINMSWMAASALFSADAFGHPICRAENGSSQQWGVASSVFGHSSSRYGLTDVLTADTSASILYMHELAHRRRLQQQLVQQSTGPGASPNMGSSSGGPWDLALGGPYAAGGTSGLNMPYQQLTSSSSGVIGSGLGTGRCSVSPGVRLAVERGHSGPSRFGYGSISSSQAPESAGVIRTSLDSRRLPRTAFAEIAEEDDEQLGSTPRLSADAHFHSFNLNKDSLTSASRHSPVPTSAAGVVTVSNVPLPRLQRATTDPSASSLPEEISPTILAGDTDTEHVWPDLPPTNC